MYIFLIPLALCAIVTTLHAGLYCRVYKREKVLLRKKAEKDELRSIQNYRIAPETTPSLRRRSPSPPNSSAVRMPSPEMTPHLAPSSSSSDMTPQDERDVKILSKLMPKSINKITVKDRMIAYANKIRYHYKEPLPPMIRTASEPPQGMLRQPLTSASLDDSNVSRRLPPSTIREEESDKHEGEGGDAIDGVNESSPLRTAAHGDRQSYTDLDGDRRTQTTNEDDNATSSSSSMRIAGAPCTETPSKKSKQREGGKRHVEDDTTESMDRDGMMAERGDKMDGVSREGMQKDGMQVDGMPGQDGTMAEAQAEHPSPTSLDISPPPNAPITHRYIIEETLDDDVKVLLDIRSANTMSGFSTNTMRGHSSLIVLCAINSLNLLMLSAIANIKTDNLNVYAILSSIAYLGLFLVGIFPSGDVQTGRTWNMVMFVNVPAKISSVIHGAGALVYLMLGTVTHIIQYVEEGQEEPKNATLCEAFALSSAVGLFFICLFFFFQLLIVLLDASLKRGIILNDKIEEAFVALGKPVKRDQCDLDRMIRSLGRLFFSYSVMDQDFEKVKARNNMKDLSEWYKDNVILCFDNLCLRSFFAEILAFVSVSVVYVAIEGYKAWTTYDRLHPCHQTPTYPLPKRGYFPPVY